MLVLLVCRVVVRVDELLNVESIVLDLVYKKQKTPTKGIIHLHRQQKYVYIIYKETTNRAKFYVIEMFRRSRIKNRQES